MSNFDQAITVEILKDIRNLLVEIRDRTPYYNPPPVPYTYPPGQWYPYVSPTCGSGGSQTINCKGGENFG
jgi:hypothetical protein